jgi:hypothetical protein
LAKRLSKAESLSRTRDEILARRRRRKPWISLALLIIVLAIWYRYWAPPVVSWAWHVAHGRSVGWRGRSIAVPKGWYARWHSGLPELHHLSVPLAHDATVTIVALPKSAGTSPYDNFRTHAADFARQSGFGIQTIRTFVHGSNEAFCAEGYGTSGMNEECAFTNADFALLLRGSPPVEPDFDAIVRSVLQ